MEEKNKYEKTVIGTIDDITITETIKCYQPKLPEQLATAMKNIRRQFEQRGYSSDNVVFTSLE